MGGIGNQLFQFSFGLLLKQRLNAEMYLDLGSIRRQPNSRRFTLLPYLDNQLFKVRNSNLLQLQLRRIQKKLLRESRKTPAKEVNNFDSIKYYMPKEIGFDPSSMLIKDNVRINGYFQSFKYFESDLIYRSMNLQPQTKWAEMLISEAKDVKPISVHIRRGDYRAESDFGLLSKKYYQEALASLSTYEREIWYFSDDKEAAKLMAGTLGRKWKKRIIISPDDCHPMEEILVLSHCHDSVIANSTFSWWGAILNQQGGEIVAPNKWFKYKKDPIDLIPPYWSKIPSDWE